jgi:hypothetical protein
MENRGMKVYFSTGGEIVVVLKWQGKIKVWEVEDEYGQ